MEKEIKNLDEVVFAERNQNYGAFYLRRSYHKHVAWALFFAVLVFSAVTAIPLIAGKNSDNYDKAIVILDTTIFLPPPVEKEEEIKLPEQRTEERVSESADYRIVSEPISDTEDLSDLFEGQGDDEASAPTVGGGAFFVDEEEIIDVIEPPKKEEIPWIVQQMPGFKGGETAMFKWLSDNIKYPQIAKEEGIEGAVVVTFVIEKDGSITNAQLLNDIGGGCGEEALRVVRLMPKWREGRQNNVPVRVQFNLPVRFILE